MATQTLDAKLQELLRGRHIATLATENADGSIHLTAVWYLFEDGALFVATSTKTRKYRNVARQIAGGQVRQARASLMVDLRRPGTEWGVSAAGVAEVITGARSEEIN